MADLHFTTDEATEAGTNPEEYNLFVIAPAIGVSSLQLDRVPFPMATEGRARAVILRVAGVNSSWAVRPRTRRRPPTAASEN